MVEYIFFLLPPYTPHIRWIFFFCLCFVSFSLFFLLNFLRKKKYKANVPWRIKKCLWWMQVIRNISYFFYYFFIFIQHSIPLEYVYAKHKTFILLQWENICIKKYIYFFKKIVTLALSSFFSPLRESCSTAESFWLFLMILHLIAFFSFLFFSAQITFS